MWQNKVNDIGKTTITNTYGKTLPPKIFPVEEALLLLEIKKETIYVTPIGQKSAKPQLLVS